LILLPATIGGWIEAQDQSQKKLWRVYFKNKLGIVSNLGYIGSREASLGKSMRPCIKKQKDWGVAQEHLPSKFRVS
jgi:hypothetical protein